VYFAILFSGVYNIPKELKELGLVYTRKIYVLFRSIPRFFGRRGIRAVSLRDGIKIPKPHAWSVKNRESLRFFSEVSSNLASAVFVFKAMGLTSAPVGAALFGFSA
jgi:hypothetical protein